MKEPWKQQCLLKHIFPMITLLKKHHISQDPPLLCTHPIKEDQGKLLGEAVLLPLHRCQEKACPELSGDGWKACSGNHDTQSWSPSPPLFRASMCNPQWCATVCFMDKMFPVCCPVSGLSTLLPASDMSRRRKEGREILGLWS